jgi:3-methyladenine DNA glycosylase/8-oxoguanine DNA glycosylase
LKGLYFPRARKVSARRLEEFSATHFGPYGGYAQQYLFHYARTKLGRAWAAGAAGKSSRVRVARARQP